MTDAEYLAANQVFADRWYRGISWAADWVITRTAQCIESRNNDERLASLGAGK